MPRDETVAPGAHVTSSRQSGSDVGRDTFDIHMRSTDASLDLPRPLHPLPSPAGALSEAQRAQLQHQADQRLAFYNSHDVNIDPVILDQWTRHEIPYQTNTTQARSGQFWAKNWENLGPLDPFTPRQPDAHGGLAKVTPGPQDPQLAYGNALVAAMDAQENKFTLHNTDSSPLYVHLNDLQQLPGSKYETYDASWDAFRTPMVVNRRAHLPQQAARWVVHQLNLQLRETHPCFSLAGREHFELSNAPQSCGSTSNQKHMPITLIRVFESRLLKVAPEAPEGPSSTLNLSDKPDLAEAVDALDNQSGQVLFLTMEIGNHISGGAGGMFHTLVTLDNRGNFIHFTQPDRDEKHTFVLPRTRS